MEKHRKLVLVGLGGIGRWVAQALPGVLLATEDSWSVTLCDGDKYDLSNVPRQCSMDEVSQPKAVVWARKIYQPERIDSEVVVHYFSSNDNLPEESIVLLAVDNHKTRKLVSDKVGEMKNCVLISGGNELTDGNVQVYVRRKGKDLTAPLGLFHPEIEEPADKAPWEKSCEEMAVHEPQITATNMNAAAIMVSYLTAFVMDPKAVPVFGETYFDIIKTTTAGYNRPGR